MTGIWLDIFVLQYLSCLSTSSSTDKLAFDVGLKEKAQGNITFCESNWYWFVH